jgi:hypothetical protein
MMRVVYLDLSLQFPLKETHRFTDQDNRFAYYC